MDSALYRLREQDGPFTGTSIFFHLKGNHEEY